MTNVHATTRRSEQGFTLVELAIVMVIIGLLIGGILKGQELIANAKISGTVSQLKGLEAAINTFQDKYGVKPGLMTDAVARLPGCAAPCANVAVGTTTYNAGFVFPVLADGGAQIFLHLNSADLISGVDPSGSSVTFGKILPNVKAGGGMYVSTANGVGNGAMALLDVGKTYAVLNGANSTPTATSGALSATTVAQIDRKLDDGMPNTGGVHVTTGCSAGGASTDIYTESSTTAVCGVAARVLN